MTGALVVASSLVQHHHGAWATPALGLAIIAAFVWYLAARRRGSGS